MSSWVLQVLRRLPLSMVASVALVGLVPGQAGALTWSQPLNLSTYPMNAVSCPTTSLCVAGDNDSIAWSNTEPTDSSDWKDGNMNSPGSPQAISCPSTQLCVAADSEGDIAFSQSPGAGADADWTVTHNVSTTRFEGISCPSTQLCVAIDSNGDVWTSTTPTGDEVSDWTSTTLPGGGYGTAYSVSCTAAPVCVVAGGSGFAPKIWTSSQPGANVATDWAALSLDAKNGPLFPSCVPTLCVLADSAGNVLTATDPTGDSATDWISTNIDGTNPFGAISCASASFCVAADYAGNALASTDPGGNAKSDWSTATADSNATSSPIGLSCALNGAAQLCAEVDPAGDVAIGQGTAPTAPVNTSPPTISGHAVQGDVLTVKHGAWTGSPASFADTWEDCNAAGGSCVAIGGATGMTYTLHAGDVGHTIRVSELAAGATSPASSAATAVVIGVTSGPSAAQIKASLSKVIVPSGKGASTKALLKSGGYSFSYAALAAGTFAISWYYLPKGAHLASAKGRPKPKAVLVASLSGRFTGAGVVRLKIKLTGKGKHLLARDKRLKVTAIGTFTPAGGAVVTVSKAFTL